MFIDPGHQVCAVLFLAVPPNNDAVYAYELYLRDCDARKFAIHVAQKCKDQQIQACIIDPNMAVYTEVASGKTVARQYSDALEAEGFEAISTGTGFVLGCDNVEAGLLAMRGWLRIGDSGKPFFRVVRGKCPSLEFEFKRYVKQRVAGQVMDKPNQKRNSHLMDASRYAALYNPRFVKPGIPKARISATVRAFRAKQERKKQKTGGNGINLGPGRNLHHA